MKYFVCNYLGVVGWKVHTENEVLKDLSSPVWKKMVESLGWFYMPESHVRFDGIRYVYDTFGHKIRTMEDFEYFKDYQLESASW